MSELLTQLMALGVCVVGMAFVDPNEPEQMYVVSRFEPVRIVKVDEKLVHFQHVGSERIDVYEIEDFYSILPRPCDD